MVVGICVQLFLVVVAVFIWGWPVAFVGSHLHLWAVVSVNGWLLAFVGSWFRCSSSLAWGAVLWLLSVVLLCGGYGG